MLNKVKITLHKTQFDFHFGLGFLGELLENTGFGIEELMAKIRSNPFKNVPIVMHASAEYAAKREGKEFEYTVFDFIDFIDADGGIAAKSVEKFLDALLKSMTQNVPEEKNVNTKKKLVPKK